MDTRDLARALFTLHEASCRRHALEFVRARHNLRAPDGEIANVSIPESAWPVHNFARNSMSDDRLTPAASIH